MAVITAQGIFHHVERQDADLDAVGGEKISAERFVKRVLIELGVAPNLLSSIFQIGKIIAPRLKEILNFLTGQTERRHTTDLIGIAQTFGQIESIVDQFAVAAKQREDGFTADRTCGRHILDILVGDAFPGKKRVAEHFFQLRRHTRFVIDGEALQVDIVSLSEFQQQLHGDRALIALDQIEVAGRNTHLLGHLALRQAALQAHPPEAWPDHDFAFRHVRCSLTRLVVTGAHRALLEIIPQRQ